MSLQERFGRSLHITTDKPEARKQHADAGGTAHRTIMAVGAFSELYELGGEVMPSTHKYMKVLFATRKSDGHEVVVKVRYKPKCFRNRDDEAMWRRSTEFLLNLPDDCGIAKIYEVLEDGTAFYIVMEKVEGLDLFETLEQVGGVSVEMAREILRQVLSAVDHLHGHNAVHKDLKLENIMLDSACLSAKQSSRKSPKKEDFSMIPSSVKVIDFDTVEEWTPASPRAKDVVGTDQYISQEAYAGRYSPLSDMFAVGVVGYRLLCGRFPYHEELFDDDAGENWVGSPKMTEIRKRLQTWQVDFTKDVWKENPMACDLVMHMLAPNEQQRPSAAAALEHPWFSVPLGDSANGSVPMASSSGAVDVFAAERAVYREDLLDDGIIVAEDVRAPTSSAAETRLRSAVAKLVKMEGKK